MPPSVPAASAALDAVERRMRELLAQNKWRQARNELKGLAKNDGARFLPLLIDANLGLARQMVAEGQVGQARQVLAYLGTIAPAERLRELEGAINRGAPVPIGGLEALALAAEGDWVRLADQLVLSFQPQRAEEGPQTALAAEWAAVHGALEAIARGAFAAAAEVLRGVPHRSAFAPWAAFAKGLVAFHTGQPERAAELWRRLPPGSATAKAAEGYLALLADGGGEKDQAWGQLSDAGLAAVCRLAGATGTAGGLRRADQLWRAGRHAESYQAARSALPNFPCAGPGWRGILSEFYFKAPFQMTESAWVPYLRFFTDQLDRGGRKNGAERMQILRMLCLFGHAVQPAEELRADWEDFLREHEAIHGRNPRLASLAYGWLGEELAAMPEGRFGRQLRMRDAGGAVRALRRSIELDPANVQAHLKLCEVYAKLKRRAERNRLLDAMAERFPSDKAVLMRAGEGCLERRAFGKGLDYLARARECDPLDPRITELILAGLAGQARQQFEQGRPDRARETLDGADRWAIDRPEDFRRARWAVLVRRGLMERRWGEPAAGAALLERARQCGPGPARWLLFAHLADRELSHPVWGESGFLEELKETLRAAPRLEAVAGALRLLRQWQGEDEDRAPDVEEKALAGAIPGALAQPYTRAEAAEVIALSRGSPVLDGALRKLVKHLLLADPDDPMARLWQAEMEGRGALEGPGGRGELEAILAEAMRRGDEAAVRGTRRLLRDLDGALPDLSEPEFEDEAFPDEAPADLALPPEIEPLLGSLRGKSEKDIRRLLKGAARAGVPDFMIDAVVQAAKGPRSNPGQGELF